MKRSWFVLLVVFSCFWTVNHAFAAVKSCIVDEKDLDRLVFGVTYGEKLHGPATEVDIHRLNNPNIVDFCRVLRPNESPHDVNIKKGKVRGKKNVHLFFSHEKFTPPIPGIILIMSRDEGFESTNSVISVWKKKGSQLAFKGVLNRNFVECCGLSKILEVRPLPDGRGGGGTYVVVGANEGGDGGEAWGSFWFGLWREPFNFDIVFEHGKWFEEMECGKLETLKYHFINDTTVKVVHGERKLFDRTRCSFSRWKTTEKSIDLAAREPIDLINQFCLDSCDGSMQMVRCEYQAGAQWDGELNRVYRKLRAILSNKGKIALKKRQKKWLRYRDAEFKRIADEHGGMLAGYDSKLSIASEENSFVKARVMKLRDLLKAQASAGCRRSPSTHADISAGPIWNNADARKKCPRVCRKASGKWNGNWVTPKETWGKDSVCGCTFEGKCNKNTNVSSVYTSLKEQDCWQSSQEEEGGDYFELECSGRNGYRIFHSGADGRSSLSVQKGGQYLIDTGMSMATHAPGMFEHVSGNLLEWRYKGNTLKALIFRIAGESESGRLKSRLMIVKIQGNKGCVVGSTTSNVKAKRMADGNLPCESE